MKTGVFIRHLLHAAPGTPEYSYRYTLSEEIEARTLGCGFEPCLLRVVFLGLCLARGLAPSVPLLPCRPSSCALLLCPLLGQG